MRTLHFATFAFLGTALIGHAGNLVTNPGFETGDFTGWTIMAASGAGCSDFGVTTNPVDAYSGNYAAFFAGTCPSSYDMILQNLATTVGDDYNFVFFVDNFNTESNSSDFQALWNGTLVQDLPGIGDGVYTEYSFTEEATSTTTTIAFEGYNKSSDYYLDDVSVADTGPATAPEPRTALLVCVGLGLVLVRRSELRPA